jgi:PilZ domain
MTEHSPDGADSLHNISPRYVFEARIQLRLQRDQRKISLQGWGRDLSESGLRAFVAEALMPGEAVVLEIPLPNSDKQVIPAKVVRVLGTEYGFQFTAVSAEQRCRIQATLKGHPAISRYSATSPGGA